MHYRPVVVAGRSAEVPAVDERAGEAEYLFLRGSLVVGTVVAIHPSRAGGCWLGLFGSRRFQGLEEDAAVDHGDGLLRCDALPED